MRRPSRPIIEVKGRAGIGGVALTPNEWIKAQRYGKDYWLYVVVNCKTQPELHLIQDPASKLNPKEEVSVVRYMVGQADWKRAAGATGVDAHLASPSRESMMAIATRSLPLACKT